MTPKSASNVGAPAKVPGRTTGVKMLNQYRHHLISLRRSENTIKLRTYFMDRFAEDFPALSKVRGAQVEAWVFDHTDWSAETLNAAISSLRSFYQWAHQMEFVAANPTVYLRPVRVPKKEQPIVLDDVLVTATWHASTRDAAVLMLGGELGLRRAEIAAFHTRDWSGSWATITGKGQKVRTLKLSPELVEVLTELRTTPGYYFPGRNGGHVHPSTIWNWTKRLIGVNTHAMRHRAITSVYKRGGKDMFATQTFAGHSSPETTGGYVHIHEDDLAIASEASRFVNAADHEWPMAA